MTAFSQKFNGKYNKRNKKDGSTGRRPRSRSAQFEAAGFTLIGTPSKWSYTWQGVFPVFRIAPGTINGLAGMVARCETADVWEWFPYGTAPEVIKARIDELIPEIMTRQAEEAEAIDWISIDEFMEASNDQVA